MSEGFGINNELTYYYLYQKNILKRKRLFFSWRDIKINDRFLIKLMLLHLNIQN